MNKQEVLKEYKKRIDPARVSTFKESGLDVLETKRAGVFVTDESGKKLIDCRTDAGSFNLGRRHPRIVGALKQALTVYDIGNYLFFSDVKVELAKALGKISPRQQLKAVTYCVSGSEAVDFAIRLARAYTGRTTIISANHGFYGMTGLALSADTEKEITRSAKPLAPGFKHVPYDNIRALKRAITRNTAAVILEPVQGEGGVYVPDPMYFSEVRKLCDEHGVLMIADEIQTGLGRTGKLLGVDHYKVVPDIITLGKSLSGGLYPISAVIYRQKYLKVMTDHPFFHMSAFGGSDLGCAVALETLKVIDEENIVERAAELSAIFEEGLKPLKEKHPVAVKEVRQKGMMIGIEMRTETFGKAIPKALRKRGILGVFLPHSPNIIRLLPPLILSPKQAKQIISAIIESIDEVVKKHSPIQ